MMSTDVFLPALPFGAPEARIQRWLKQPGELVAKGDPLLIILNDRVEAAIPATMEGVLEAALVAEGALASVGSPIARIAPASPPQPDLPQASHLAAPALPQRTTPVAARIAVLAGIDIRELSGSGPGGRILKRDVLAALAGRSSGDEGRAAADQPLSLNAPSAMRRAIAEHMTRSRATSPHALTAMDVDMGRVAAERARMQPIFAQRGLDLTYTACIALAAVEALQHHSLLNSAWSDDGIIVRRRIHLGIAVALSDGLLTPVVRDAQDLSLRGMARAVSDLARRARAGALRPGETSGGTFTITNPGAGAIVFGTPILNQPQAAILGVGAIAPRPLVVSDRGVDRIAVRPSALLTLAYDARVLDQGHADAFLAGLKHALEHFVAQ